MRSHLLLRRHPTYYGWSSYRFNSRCEPASWLTPHPLYTDLAAMKKHDSLAIANYFTISLILELLRIVVYSLFSRENLTGPN
jgi:hypothetical protein